jgi:hypothetical protein
MLNVKIIHSTGTDRILTASNPALHSARMGKQSRQYAAVFMTETNPTHVFSAF